MTANSYNIGYLDWGSAQQNNGVAATQNAWNYIAYVVTGTTINSYWGKVGTGITTGSTMSFSSVTEVPTVGGSTSAGTDWYFFGDLAQIRYTSVARTITSVPTGAFPSC